MKTQSGRLVQCVLVTAVLTIANPYTFAAEATGVKTDHAEGHTEHAKVVQGVGVIKEINLQAGTVTLAHEAIPELNWPAMTMPFKVSVDATKNVSIGQKVEFELTGEGNAAVITKLEQAK